MCTNVRLSLACVAALAFAGCFKYHTADEGPLLDDQGDGDEAGAGDGDLGGDGDGDDDDDQGDGDRGDGDDDDDNGDGDRGDGDGDGDMGSPGIPGLDCDDPPDQLTAFLCSLAEQAGGNPGGGGILGGGGGNPGGGGILGGGGGTPGGGGILGGGGGTPGGGGILGGGGGTPGGGGAGGANPLAELLGIDCKKPNPQDFLAQLLCGAGLSRN